MSDAPAPEAPAPQIPAPAKALSREAAKRVLIVWALALACAFGALASIRRYQLAIIERIEFVDAPASRKAEALAAQADLRLSRLRAKLSGKPPKLSESQAAEAREILRLYEAADALLEADPPELFDRMALTLGYLGEEQAMRLASAKSFLASGKWEAALSSAREAGGAEGSLAAAEALIAGGKLDDAQAEALKLLESDSKLSGAFYVLARVARERQAWTESARHFEAGLEHEPKGASPAGVLLELATVREAAGDFSKAESVLLRAKDFKTRDPAVYHRLGLVQLRAGKPAEAARSLRKAADLLPTHFDLWWDLRRALSAAGDAEGASEALSRAMALDPRLAARKLAEAEAQAAPGR